MTHKCLLIQVDVNVPRLSSEPKRPWLSYSLSTNSLDKINIANRAPSSERPAATGGRYSLTSEHSIQHWLQQIKGHVETEDDDFELISSPRTHTGEAIILLCWFYFSKQHCLLWVLWLCRGHGQVTWCSFWHGSSISLFIASLFC